MDLEIKNIDNKYHSLLELTQSVESVINKTYTKSYWVKAEIAKLNFYPKSGHCYPDLVEKQNGKVVAQMRAIIWAGSFKDMSLKFTNVTNEKIGDGMTVLLRCSVKFSPIYGLSLQIHDIEPSFTLGELAKEKQKSIARLKDEGKFYKNKQLLPPLLIQRLAIISVETSKGYQDFIKVIDNNEWGYKFFHMLFPALLQGDGAVKSITSQLTSINKIIHHFDAVLIIRGGGGDIGLSIFDNYNLASSVADFPIPVITGIGHSTNFTVSEQVSFVNKITPTEVGYYLIHKFHKLSVRIQDVENILLEKSNGILSHNREILKQLSTKLKATTERLVYQNNLILKDINYKFINAIQKSINKQNHLLNNILLLITNQTNKLFIENNHTVMTLTEKIRLLHPENILKRGYSITVYEGKVVKDAKFLNDGDILETTFTKGKTISIVNK
ncbi:MAG: exodeoxyribonuclease VII large subunit [Lentimicrobiaceae bacterium]|jgi:exodeoxyribonuclease VII large subunit|nr:exodeoxyribonuclease VII large subunit [Lentimicrobiaceae bacterium]MBT3453892.1 exodeoxyribonuclease VII large subunit [Lentimicrobiaceae bacterium]MBT3819088.1 exodeoxyribonuclease VII large subunit [Lentimicrobiaceae bacterium]MBT4060516.1 exodeoxyribonuclease VII large subunit [Lentimicrobiaceae bacterium]MBT4190595.1 exodeoxyribonuclease VII large subunit [Lentimicrobiaceae bacterium]